RAPVSIILPLDTSAASSRVPLGPETDVRKHERPRVTRPVAFGKASPRACPARGIRRQLRRRCSGQGPPYQNQSYQRTPRRHLEHGATIRAQPEQVKPRNNARTPPTPSPPRIPPPPP